MSKRKEKDGTVPGPPESSPQACAVAAGLKLATSATRSINVARGIVSHRLPEAPVPAMRLEYWGVMILSSWSTV